MWIIERKRDGFRIEKVKSDEENYVARYGKHFNGRLQEFAAAQLKNVDGTTHRFTEKDLPSTVKIPHPHDLLYMANWLYSDGFPEPLKTTQAVWQEALRHTNDPDGYEGMAFCRWRTDMEQRDIDIPWADMMED